MARIRYIVPQHEQAVITFWCAGPAGMTISLMNEDLVTVSPRGLFCRAGDFYIDPWAPVPTALITHAHSDHARAGSAHYVTAASNVPLLRKRLGQDIAVDGPAYGEPFSRGGVQVSFHAAGHILGSSQIRIEGGGEVWVVSGDYKRDPDPTCAAFEVVPCDTFISEATFALPIYRWRSTGTVAADIFQWWQVNRAAGVTTVLFCYALGKAQRVLAELLAYTSETVLVHGAVAALLDLYRQQNVALLPTALIDSLKRGSVRESLVLAPPGAAGSPWLRRFEPCATGFCSGWMQVRGQRRRRGYDRGFVLSDHADWPSLLTTVRETGAKRILLTHGYSDALVRYLREQGVAAAALKTAYGDEN